MALSGAAAGASALPPGVPYGAEITAAAKRHGLDPALLAGLVRQESNFNPTAGSPAGARGLTQLMPATAASLGVTDVTDPAQALEGGAKYLKQQLDTFGGDVTKALAAYNAGPGAVQRYGGVPPYAETQNYVQKVQAFAAAYRGTPTGATAAAPAAAAPAAAAPAAGTSSLPYSIV
jgi:soluble lytic murein transglycosylase-like protein